MENNNKKVSVVCTVGHMVSINVPSVPFKREWIGKGAVQKVDIDTLEQVLYDPGAKYIFDNGILYIEDMEQKQELGLEPVDAKEPVNIIVLSDKEKRNLLINKPLDEFKSIIDKLSIEQTTEVAQYAIDNKLPDLERDRHRRDAHRRPRAAGGAQHPGLQFLHQGLRRNQFLPAGL